MKKFHCIYTKGTKKMTLSELLQLFEKNAQGATVLKISAGGTGNTAGGDGAGGGSAKTFFANSNSTSIAAGTSRFVSINGNRSVLTSQDPTSIAIGALEHAVVMPMAGSFKNLYAASNIQPSTGQTFTIALVVNESVTTLSAEITDAGYTGSDTTHSVSVSAGDYVALKITVSAGDNPFNGTYSLEFDPS